MSRAPVLFHTDFQQLVGVQLDRDPRLSEFICKKCHVKFYKCHSILIRFLQRVNLPPVGEGNLKPRWVRGTGSENCFYPRCFTIIFPTFRKNVKYPESSVNHGPKSKYALHFFYFLYLFLHKLQKKPTPTWTDFITFLSTTIFYFGPKVPSQPCVLGSQSWRGLPVLPQPEGSAGRPVFGFCEGCLELCWWPQIHHGHSVCNHRQPRIQ